MCGRYSVMHSAEEIAARFGVDVPGDYSPRYNVAPTQCMPVVRPGGERHEREISNLRWGLIPFWADDTKIGSRMINARAETAASKPSFRAAFGRRRCLVPADGFYEWVEMDDQKWPIRITVGDDDLGAFAGLWERWSGDDGDVVESYTILTTKVAPVISDLHDRMPVWAPREYWRAWLEDDEDAQTTLESMIEKFPAETVGYGPVSRKLNRPTYDGPELVDPIDEARLPRR